MRRSSQPLQQSQFGGRNGITVQPHIAYCLTRFDREPIMMAGTGPRYAL